MGILRKCLSGLFAVAISLPMPAFAQGPFSIAYRVNDSIISHFDIDQRVKLMRSLGAKGQNLRQQATTALIDDRLKQGVASDLGMAIDKKSLDQAISSYAAQRNLSPQSLLAKLRRAGVARESFKAFISTSLLWNSVLRGRFADQAAPSEIELNAQLNSYAISSAQTLQLGEIVLPYLGRGQEATVALANRIIADLKAGKSFTKLAKQYSRSQTAARGGVIGWIAPNRLPAQIKAAIRGLGRGAVADPIYIPSGIVLLKVLDARTISKQISVPVTVNVTYAKLIIPTQNSSPQAAMTQANSTRRGLDGCRGLQARIGTFGTGSGVFGPVSLTAIDPEIGLTLARLEPRDSAVMRSNDALSVVVLCDRVSNISPDSRNILRGQLLARNMNALSEGYLLELRRTSVIQKQ